jgi:hypothetical protein
MAQTHTRIVIKNTADIRAKLLEVWRLVDEKKISLSEARVHVATARAVLDSIKVEIAMAHLSQSIAPITLGKNPTISSLGPESRKQ